MHSSDTMPRSSCADAMFIVRGGNAKPDKHVVLGMAVKGITCSKKLVQVLNRFGHTLNYNSLEELETSTAEKIEEREQECPEGTVKGQPMGVAFDNFDEMTQTLSGSETLHDTMGILYQNIPSAENEEVSMVEIPAIFKLSSGPWKGRKRSLEPQETSLMPYRKKPRMTTFSYTNTDIFNFTASSSTGAKNLDFLWMTGHALGVDKHPMWVGFNAKSCEDTLPKQEVRYCTWLT